MASIMKTLVLNPPSFENFDGGASSQPTSDAAMIPQRHRDTRPASSGQRATRGWEANAPRNRYPDVAFEVLGASSQKTVRHEPLVRE